MGTRLETRPQVPLVQQGLLGSSQTTPTLRTRMPVAAVVRAVVRQLLQQQVLAALVETMEQAAGAGVHLLTALRLARAVMVERAS